MEQKHIFLTNKICKKIQFSQVSWAEKSEVVKMTARKIPQKNPPSHNFSKIAIQNHVYTKKNGKKVNLKSKKIIAINTLYFFVIFG